MLEDEEAPDETGRVAAADIDDIVVDDDDESVVSAASMADSVLTVPPLQGRAGAWAGRGN